MNTRALLPCFIAALMGAAAYADGVPAPAFTHTRADEWLNTAPLSWKDLKGQVVLVEFWAFECWNCERSLPWLQSLPGKFGDRDFRVIGVHTPELESERVRDNVVRAVQKNGIRFPVVLDNDYSYWVALKNQYWPAFYLVDRHGRLRGTFAGETHPGDANAAEMEAAIAALIKEEP